MLRTTPSSGVCLAPGEVFSCSGWQKATTSDNRGLDAFNPRLAAILLVGGDKTWDDRFYETFIPVADRLYDAYVDDLRREGLIT